MPCGRPQYFREEAKAKQDHDMIVWLRKHDKGHSVDVDLEWIRFVRYWFESVACNGKISVEDIQRILAAAGVSNNHDEVMRCLEAHPGAGSSLFEFVEFILDVDEACTTRATATLLVESRWWRRCSLRRKNILTNPIEAAWQVNNASAGFGKSHDSSEAAFAHGTCPSGIGYARQRQLNALYTRFSRLDRIEAFANSARLATKKGSKNLRRKHRGGVPVSN